MLVYCSHDSSFVILGTTSGLLSLGSSELAGSLARGGGELDELLRGTSDHERGNGDHLLADGDVSLSDEDTGLMDGSGEVSLDNEGLETSFHELVDGQTEDVIELSLVLVEETKSDHSLDKGITFENSSGIGFIHGQKDTGGLSELGENELLTPDLSLASETVNTNGGKIVDKLLLLEGTSRVLRLFGIVSVLSWHF